MGGRRQRSQGDPEAFAECCAIVAFWPVKPTTAQHAAFVCPADARSRTTVSTWAVLGNRSSRRWVRLIAPCGEPAQIPGQCGRVTGHVHDGGHRSGRSRRPPVCSAPGPRRVENDDVRGAGIRAHRRTSRAITSTRVSVGISERRIRWRPVALHQVDRRGFVESSSASPEQPHTRVQIHDPRAGREVPTHGPAPLVPRRRPRATARTRPLPCGTRGRQRRGHARAFHGVTLLSRSRR